MDGEFTPLHATELDATNFLEWRDRILSFESNPATIEPRTYPGYPRWPLLRVAPRPWPPLERSLMRRRSATTFSTAMPSKRVLSRLLCLAHGIYADRARGPVPSAGGVDAPLPLLVTLPKTRLATRARPFSPHTNILSPPRFSHRPPATVDPA